MSQLLFRGSLSQLHTKPLVLQQCCKAPEAIPQVFCIADLSSSGLSSGLCRGNALVLTDQVASATGYGRVYVP